MESDQHYITRDGLQQIEEELVYLQTVRRAEIAEKLAEAITHGEIAENVEYMYTKQEQSLLEGRIQALEDAIRYAIVIEPQIGSDTVCIGCTVTIAEEGWDEVERYKIVGPHEAAPANGLISNKSPIGSALLGAKIGETVVALTPAGEMRVRIVAIA